MHDYKHGHVHYMGSINLTTSQQPADATPLAAAGPCVRKPHHFAGALLPLAYPPAPCAVMHQCMCCISSCHSRGCRQHTDASSAAEQPPAVSCCQRALL